MTTVQGPAIARSGGPVAGNGHHPTDPPPPLSVEPGGLRSLPLTPVVGYVRVETPAEAAGLSAVLDEYAQGAGLVIGHMHRETGGATGATLPAFAACLEQIHAATARGILLPSWAHLAPNGLLGAALLHAVDQAGALLYVADESSAPEWALQTAAQFTVWGRR